MSYSGFILGLIKVSQYHYFMLERKDLQGSKRSYQALDEFGIFDRSGTALEEFLLSISVVQKGTTLVRRGKKAEKEAKVESEGTTEAVDRPV